MLNTRKMRSIYSEIQTQLFYMIPEKWDKICLYASVIEQVNHLETGEMFFYYFPFGLLKKNPVNVYEIPNKFNIDEEEYMKLVNKLYSTIIKLRNEFKAENQEMWTNLTITIADAKFKVEYSYDDLIGSKFDSNERHIVWKCKHLDYPIERLTRKERKMVQEYTFDENLVSKKVKIYTEGMYRQRVHNIVEYDTEENFIKVDIKDDESDSENVKANRRINGKDKYILYKYEQKTEKENEKKASMKNQILNF